jgi:C1A family cysteine protease
MIGTRHAYGWKRPLPGMSYPRADTTGLTILAEVDPRRELPPVFDQGQLGSCTANATAACFQYDSITAGKDCGVLSRRWIYHFEKALEGTLGQGDTGAMGHDAFRVAKHGIPDESEYPYSEDIAEVEAKPPDVEPRAYRLTREVRSVVQSMNAVKQVLSNRQTVAIGFTVYESFEDPSWTSSGLMPMPQPGEGVLGGHEVLVVGYLTGEPHYALVRNSWGKGWGLGGYFLFPWAALLDPNIASDFRTIRR